MRQISLRLVFLSLYAIGTLAATLRPEHPPVFAVASATTVSASSTNSSAKPNAAADPAANTTGARPRRAARIDFRMPYYRFGRLPMRL